MNLLEVIGKYQDQISDNGILVEYNLFLKNIIEKHCKFVIDDIVDLENLNNVILKIKERDIYSEVYVSTYGIDFTDTEILIYGDTLWINTLIGPEVISDYFNDFQAIKPSDIVSLDESETIDGTIALVISADNKVEGFQPFIEKKQLSRIKSLYWD